VISYRRGNSVIGIVGSSSFSKTKLGRVKCADEVTMRTRDGEGDVPVEMRSGNSLWVTKYGPR
jgi:hypothetical protein